jgi:hypothetical protein
MQEQQGEGFSMSSGSKKEVSDQGTPEMNKRRQLKPELAGQGYTYRMRVTDQTASDRLLLSKLVTLDEHATLERLSEDMDRGQLLSLKVQDFEPRVSGGEGQSIAVRVAEARSKVNDIMKHLGLECGPWARALMVSIARDELSQPPDPILLKAGIKALAKFYEEGKKK